MNTKSKILLVIIIVAALLTVTTMVNAQSVSMNLSSSSKLEEGTTVDVKVNLGSIDAGDGIDTITGKLDYDKEVFEEISSDSITAGTNWTPTYAPSTGKINILKSEKTTSGETVITIKFKVKSSISVNSTTITLKDIVVSGGRVQDGGTGDIDVSNASVTLKKDSAASNPTDSSSSGTVKQITAKSSDSTKAVSSKLPQTGVSYDIVIAMAVVMVIGAVSFVRYTVVKKDLK